MRMRNDLTQDDVVSRFDYCKMTGIFRSKRSGRQVGTVKKGSRSGRTYVRIKIRGIAYGAHRLAWLYVTGQMPELGIDHRNGDSLDNRFDNLRLSTVSQNTANAHRRKPSSLPRGVFATTSSAGFGAQIRNGGRRVQVKGFETAELAGEFYNLMAEMVYGDFAYHLGAGAIDAARKQGANHD